MCGTPILRRAVSAAFLAEKSPKVKGFRAFGEYALQV
jgi:hypothetical protein